MTPVAGRVGFNIRQTTEYPDTRVDLTRLAMRHRLLCKLFRGRIQCESGRHFDVLYTPHADRKNHSKRWQGARSQRSDSDRA
jgi:hypothetical protein